VVAAKSTEETPNLPGTVHSVAAECIEAGKLSDPTKKHAPVEAMGLKCDLRSVESCEQCVEETVKRFGRVDILINNASALWWQDIQDTPMQKFDLIMGINARGTFAITKACLPHMERNGFGRVISMSPPIRLDLGAFAGHTAYMSKYGMTMVSLGVAAEYLGKGVTGNSVWPATVVESYASINFKLGDEKDWRKATILADAAMSIISEPDTFTGHMLIDDTYLRTRGLKDEDFVQYRCDPAVEPPRVLDQTFDGDVATYGTMAKRGDVKTLDNDLSQSTGWNGTAAKSKL